MIRIIACCLGAMLFACTGTETINCVEMPTASACLEACAMDPSLSHCSGTDAGPDAMVEDVGAEDASDAGPDAMLPCGMECSGMTPMCREADQMCVQCLTPADCAGMGDAVMCSEAGLCVECTENSHCDEAGASVCSTEGITAGSCVACTAGSATDCEGIAAGSICDDASGSGVCVECNAGDETACGMDVCDVDMRTCATGVRQGSAEACEACVSDRQCEDGHACVPVGAEEPRGYYCMKDNTAGCERPFAIDLNDRTSIGGVAGVTYCGINEMLASCENVRGLLDDATCPGGTDEECPEGGLCRRVGSLADRCTYECGGTVECDSAPRPGSSCGNVTNMGMGPDYCGGAPM